MPGIVGLITKISRQQSEENLLRMLETMRHESFYETGTWIDEAQGVYVGWVLPRRSSSAGIPFRNERGDVTMVFSGEEFPDPSTIRRLKEQGHAFDSKTASYLVHSYEDDQCFPAGLNGRFHGLVVDRSRGTLVLFNDRYGMQRLYYHESKDAFYFAAEAKAILAIGPELRTTDARSLAEFVSCDCVLENRTLFRNIYVLPPGSAWVFRNSSIDRKGTYFQPQEWENQVTLDLESSYHELREVFSKNIPRYFVGDDQIAMSLTGGLDTRMIMAWQKSPPGSLPCYTFGSMYCDNRDVVVARRVARACHQSHEVIPVGGDFLSRFSHYAERSVYLTDACVDVSRAPDLYVQQRAREIGPVRISGTYGSEILRPVRPKPHKGQRWAAAFKPWSPTPGLFHPDFFSNLTAASYTYERLLEGHPVSFSAFRQAPWYHYGVLALEQTQLTVRSPYLDNDFVRTVYRMPHSALASSDVCLRLIADGDSSLRRFRTDRGLAGPSGPLSSGARRFLEFTFKAEYAYDYGMPQFVARIDHFFSRLRLERLFLGQHKFYHFRVWYRDALSKYVREMLLDSRTISRSYIERAGLEAVVAGHLRGDRNYTNEIHKLLTLELIHRLFIDSK